MTLAAVALAGLAGSLHCAAMCGGFVVLATGGRRAPGRQLAWHAGRATAYVGLGAAAGALAGGLDGLSETFLGVQSVASVLLGLLIVGMAAHAFGLRWPVGRAGRRGEGGLVGGEGGGSGGGGGGGLVQIGSRPRALDRLGARVARFARRGGVGAPALLGLASALLPCAWLWTFVALAGATGGALSGAAVMAAFWLGTVPALLAVGGLSARLTAYLRRYAARVTALGMLAAAVLAFGTRWDHGLRARAAAERDADFTCHGGATPVPAATARAASEPLANTEPPPDLSAARKD